MATPAVTPSVTTDDTAEPTTPSAHVDGYVVPTPQMARDLRGAVGKVRSYVMLTKPRIIELLLITTVPMMVVAQQTMPRQGLPSLWLMIATVIGGSLAAGGANTFNCYIDRDIDVKMARTRKRPLPAGEVSPTGALIFGVALEVAAFAWLWATTNLLSACLGVAATAFYVFIYTLGLKRSTPQNIVIGGAAGAVPVLIGWSAVTNSVSLASIVAFLLIFYWTPPHFWALAIKYKDDYAAAGVPMLPVVATMEETTRQIWLYSWIMVAISLVFFAVAQMGLIYAVAAIVLGGIFLKMAWDLKREPSVRKAMHLFHYSISYLALIFAAMAVDAMFRII